MGKGGFEVEDEMPLCTRFVGCRQDKVIGGGVECAALVVKTEVDGGGVAIT